MAARFHTTCGSPANKGVRMRRERAVARGLGLGTRLFARSPAADWSGRHPFATSWAHHSERLCNLSMMCRPAPGKQRRLYLYPVRAHGFLPLHGHQPLTLGIARRR